MVVVVVAERTAADRVATDRLKTMQSLSVATGTASVRRPPSRPTASDMEAALSQYEFTMSLRIRHPDVEPADITSALGIEPEHSWRAGEPRRNASGQALEGAYRESYWMGRLMAEPRLASDDVSVESEVLRTLAQLRKSFTFLSGLKLEGAVTELLVSIFVRGDFRLEFLPESLALLGRLGFTVSFDIQPHPQVESPEVPH